MENIAGKTALVTGASQGLGRVIALELAKAGCRVIVNYANHSGNAEKVVAEISAAGGTAEPFRCDVSDEPAVRAMFATLEERCGGVDILVNNARIDPWRREASMSEGEWFDRVLSINLKGALLTSLAFMPKAMERRYGRIVNVSSVRAFRAAEPNMIAYGVSKLGMHGLTRAFAEQGAPVNVTCNTVAPGMILTENIAKRLTPEKYAEECSAIPMRRGGTAEEIADAVLFPIRNGYVTGETININGGMYYAP